MRRGPNVRKIAEWEFEIDGHVHNVDVYLHHFDLTFEARVKEVQGGEWSRPEFKGTELSPIKKAVKAALEAQSGVTWTDYYEVEVLSGYSNDQDRKAEITVIRNVVRFGKNSRGQKFWVDGWRIQPGWPTGERSASDENPSTKAYVPVTPEATAVLDAVVETVHRARDVLIKFLDQKKIEETIRMGLDVVKALGAPKEDSDA